MKNESTQRLNYFIRTYLKKFREILYWAHNIFRYTLVTYTKWKRNATMWSNCQWKLTKCSLDEYDPRKKQLETTDWTRNSVVVFGKN